MKIFFTLFNLFMTAVIVFAGVDAVYSVIFSDADYYQTQKINADTGSAEISVKKDETGSLEKSLNQYSQIYERNLFGTLVSKKDSKPDIDIKSLEKTRLNLKLLGTVVGFNINYAVIVVENNQGLYKEDDEIKDAKIKRIFRQKVVLTRNGKDEILTIDEEEGQKQKYYKSVDESINQSGENSYEISREFIDKSLENMNSLMRQARVRPNFENGKPAGLKIESIRPFSLFKKMGLENGDVLVGANGKEIKTVNDAIGVYHSLKSAEKIALDIKRNGSNQTIEYNIDE
ncbi:MAG: type II secretion system protein GspC [Thermodesulfobacteriota bacterium]